jgi:hypothetical protein
MSESQAPEELVEIIHRVHPDHVPDILEFVRLQPSEVTIRPFDDGSRLVTVLASPAVAERANATHEDASRKRLSDAYDRREKYGIHPNSKHSPRTRGLQMQFPGEAEQHEARARASHTAKGGGYEGR